MTSVEVYGLFEWVCTLSKRLRDAPRNVSTKSPATKSWRRQTCNLTMTRSGGASNLPA